jgi:hypothetical protein
MAFDPSLLPDLRRPPRHRKNREILILYRWLVKDFFDGKSKKRNALDGATPSPRRHAGWYCYLTDIACGSIALKCSMLILLFYEKIQTH